MYRALSDMMSPFLHKVGGFTWLLAEIKLGNVLGKLGNSLGVLKREQAWLERFGGCLSLITGVGCWWSQNVVGSCGHNGGLYHKVVIPDGGGQLNVLVDHSSVGAIFEVTINADIIDSRGMPSGS